MRFSVRDLVYIAIFGAIWGALEMTLGSYLHLLIPPPATPLIGAGAIMTAIGMILVLIGRLFVPRVGSALMIGLVTAVLKALSIGGVTLSPMTAIVIECLWVEAALLLAGKPGRWAFVLAGSLAVLWTFFHKFFASTLFLGKSIYDVYLGMLREGGQAIGIEGRSGLVIVAIFPLVRIVMGGAAGWLAWELGEVVQVRLSRVTAAHHE